MTSTDRFLAILRHSILQITRLFSCSWLMRLGFCLVQSFWEKYSKIVESKTASHIHYQYVLQLLINKRVVVKYHLVNHKRLKVNNTKLGEIIKHRHDLDSAYWAHLFNLSRELKIWHAYALWLLFTITCRKNAPQLHL